MENLVFIGQIFITVVALLYICAAVTSTIQRDEARVKNKKLQKENKKLKKEMDEALDLNDELLSQLGIADKQIAELEREEDINKEETRRWNNNYQSMKRKKMKFQKFMIDFKEGDGDKIDKLLKGMLSENKYLKAKKQKDEIDINKQG